MMLFQLLVVIVVLQVCYATAEKIEQQKKSTALTGVEHLIVLMMENRSFDHMLGLLKKKNPEITGCLPDEEGCSNPVHVSDPNSPRVTVSDDAVYVQASPDHSIHGTTHEIFGMDSPTADSPALMNGFIEQYTKSTGSETEGQHIMRCFAEEHLPVLSNLTMEYAVIDGWFAGLPGPTMPNRAFAASATSHGMGTNDYNVIVRGMPQKTMFGQLSDMGLDYRVYFQSVPSVLQHKEMRRREARHSYHPLRKFYDDVAAGDLPTFTWVEPNYFVTEKHPATDQHPDHDVSLGEDLIKQVYEAVRNGPLWEKSALIITYDEHGGFFDHVAPPSCPSPDGLVSTDDPFDFTRLGVRVPTVVVSPLVKPGAVIHAPPAGQGQYEHSSIPATVVHKMFQPATGHKQPDYLNARDAWAATFEHVFDNPLRTDCPKELPRTFKGGAAPTVTPQSPVTDLQVDLLAVVAGVAEDAFNVTAVRQWTNAQAAEYITSKLDNFFERKIVDLLN